MASHIWLGLSQMDTSILNPLVMSKVIREFLSKQSDQLTNQFLVLNSVKLARLVVTRQTN